MDREERLRELARKYYELSFEEKLYKAEKEGLREDLFKLMEYDFKGKEHLLPVQTVEVPKEFFHSTGMSKEEFAQTRFPGWNIEHCEMNTATGVTVFVFKKDPAYVARVVEVETEEDEVIRLSRVIADATPELDWESLSQERPDLAQKLGKPRMVYDIDEEEFERLIEEKPEELATLKRHMKTRPPVQKIVSKKVGKKDAGKDN